MYADNLSLKCDTQIMGPEADLRFEQSDLQLDGPDMLVDEYEQYNDRPDVVDISPDGASEEPAEVEPMADDCTCDCIPFLGLFLQCTEFSLMLAFV
jgi:hypothetical protein